MAAGALDLDPPAHRALARELAEASVVLLDNDGTLPLGDRPDRSRSSAPAPTTRSPFLGCYSFPNHGVMAGHADLGLGIEVPTLLDGLRGELPGATLVHEPGCPIQEPDRVAASQAAADAARGADVCVAVVGDRPGLFGRGTSGEGCDAEDLSLPGIQDELVDALLATGTPRRARGRVGPAVRARPLRGPAGRGRAGVPPRRGGRPALAGVLSGRVVPSGKLPVQIPRSARRAAEHLPASRRSAATAAGVSSLDPTPAVPVRPRPLVHDLRATRTSPSGADEIADRRRGRGVVRRAQHGRPRRRRGRPALPRRPGRAGHAAGDPARGLRARRARAGRAGARHLPPARRPHRRSPASTSGASSSRARSSVMIGASSGTSGGAERSGSPATPRVVGHDRVMTTPASIQT